MGGYTKFMKLKPRGINNIFTATVNAFVVGAQESTKRHLQPRSMLKAQRKTGAADDAVARKTYDRTARRGREWSRPKGGAH